MERTFSVLCYELFHPLAQDLVPYMHLCKIEDLVAEPFPGEAPRLLMLSLVRIHSSSDELALPPGVIHLALPLCVNHLAFSLCVNHLGPLHSCQLWGGCSSVSGFVSMAECLATARR